MFTIHCTLPAAGMRLCFKTHTEVSVPDLDGAILAACCDELSVAAVGAACGDDFLTLEGARLEHRLVLLL